MSEPTRGEVVALDAFRNGKKKIPVTDLVPLVEIHRMTGFYIELARGPEASFPVAGQPIEPLYTIATTEDLCEGIITDAKWELIDRLDPSKDKGWVIVRHHETKREASTYLDAHFDTRRSRNDDTPRVYHNGDGYYTVVHVPAPKGAPDHLLIYFFRSGSEDDEDPANIGTNEIAIIYHPDGTVTGDFEALLPED